MERLQKVIAASGICSRRAAEDLILKGAVRVNNTIIRELGTKVGPEDAILINGKPLPKVQTVTYALYKPRGVVCSAVKQGDAQIVTDLVPAYPPVFSIGRLDKESEGLILLTNDGALANKLTHPSYEHSKEYWVVCRPELGVTADLAKIKANFEKGVKLGDGKAIAENVQVKKDGADIIISLLVKEGRHHLIRRMCATQRLDVRRLKRTKFATLSLDTLKPGAHRTLTSAEIQHLYA